MTTFLQIANTIKSTPAPVNVVNTGLCASAAVGLMQGATGKRYAFSDSYFILHGCAGGAKDLRDRCNEYIEKLLKEKTQIPDEWMPFGGNEHTLSAKEALEYGIIDEVVDNYNLITNDTELKNKQ
jgi:ATP-dependent protease ClpP protease subunit